MLINQLNECWNLVMNNDEAKLYDEYGLAKHERMEIRMSAARSAAEALNISGNALGPFKSDVISLARMIERYILNGD